MAAASSPMPVPTANGHGQGNNGGTPKLVSKGAPTPMGRRRESRVRFCFDVVVVVDERKKKKKRKSSVVIERGIGTRLLLSQDLGLLSPSTATNPRVMFLALSRIGAWRSLLRLALRDAKEAAKNWDDDDDAIDDAAPPPSPTLFFFNFFFPPPLLFLSLSLFSQPPLLLLLLSLFFPTPKTRATSSRISSRSSKSPRPTASGDRDTPSSRSRTSSRLTR